MGSGRLRLLAVIIFILTLVGSAAIQGSHGTRALANAPTSYLYLPLIVSSGSSRFGVLSFAGAGAETLTYVTDLGVQWMRFNDNLDRNDPDFALFLGAKVNLVITLVNREPGNVNTTYGTLAQYPNAGFPYLSKAEYQQRIRETISPTLPYIGARQVWVQAENEASDVAANPDARYWRGTTDQYLVQLQALYEVIKAINPSLPVVLTSFASEALDAVLDPNNPYYNAQSARLTKLLTQGQYDAVDLHFYGCVENIAAKVQWVKDHLPVGKHWISTENGGPDYRCPSTPIPWYQNQTLFEQVQAQQVPARLSACGDNGGSVCLWFSLYDLVNEPSDVFNHLGLLDPRVLPPRQKPAYGAFKTFTASHH